MNEWVARLVFLIGGIIVFKSNEIYTLSGLIYLDPNALFDLRALPSFIGYVLMLLPWFTVKPTYKEPWGL